MRHAVILSAAAVLLCLTAAPSPAAYTFRDLHPAGYTNSIAVAVHGRDQAGYVNHFGPRAMAWGGTAESAVDLHAAAPFLSPSQAHAVWGGRQGGHQTLVVQHEGSGHFVDHALLWSGAAGSVVDIHPGPEYSTSYIHGMNATRQVGSAYLGFGNEGRRRAGYWTDTPGSYVDIHPADFDISFATAISDTDDQIVGNGYTSRLPGSHPLLWTDGRVVDLRPPNFQYVEGRGVSDGRQVGYGFGDATGGNQHALLWEGSAEGYLDLNPAGFAESYAFGIAGAKVAGAVRTGGGQWRAALWSLGEDSLSGATVVASLTDLHAALPPEYTGSQALGVDRAGFIVGHAFHAPSGQWHAALWVPEPSAALAVTAAGLVLITRRRPSR